METSLPLFCEEEEALLSRDSWRQQLPPTRGWAGMDYEGMSHAGRGGGVGGEGFGRNPFFVIE